MPNLLYWLSSGRCAPCASRNHRNNDPINMPSDMPVGGWEADRCGGPGEKLVSTYPSGIFSCLYGRGHPGPAAPLLLAGCDRGWFYPKGSAISNFLAKARRFESKYVPRSSDSCLSTHCHDLSKYQRKPCPGFSVEMSTKKASSSASSQGRKRETVGLRVSVPRPGWHPSNQRALSCSPWRHWLHPKPCGCMLTAGT